MRGPCGVVRRSKAEEKNVVGCSCEGLLGEGGEEAEPVGAGTGEVLDRVLGVGHQADDVAALVGDPGDVTERAVGVVSEVARDHATLALEQVERRLVGDEAALPVLEHDRDLRALGVGRRPRGVDALDAQPLVAADELAVVVADQRTRQQVRLAEDLEAVADAEHGQALAGRLDHRRHHRGEAGDRAAAEVVAVGEAAGQHDRVDALEVVVAVPERDRLVAADRDGATGIDVVERAGEGDDTDLHARPASCATSATECSSTCTSKSSMTGLDSSVPATSSIRASTSGVISPSTWSSNRLPCRTSVTRSNPSRGSAPSTALPWGSRISGLGMTSTTTRATGMLLGDRVGRALPILRSRRAIVPGGHDGGRGRYARGGGTARDRSSTWHGSASPGGGTPVGAATSTRPGCRSASSWRSWAEQSAVRTRHGEQLSR